LPPPGHDTGGGRPDGRGPPRILGKILRYDKAKGYGFLTCGVGDNVFFPRNILPKELNEAGEKELKELEFSFEIYYLEEGKPRAKDLEVATFDGSASSSGAGMAPAEGEVLCGIIVRYDMTKGYGFVKPDSMNEDVFFLRSELPAELSGAQRKEEVERRRVEFEMRSMPDGKLRASGLALLPDDNAGEKPAGKDSDRQPLDEDVLAEMADFLAQKGGVCDYGKFSSVFIKVKKKGIRKHFDIVPGEGGRDQIVLPEGHPARAFMEPQAEAKEEDDEKDLEERMKQEEEEEELKEEFMESMSQEGASAGGAAVSPGPGCEPFGFIRSYDATKGFGFVICEGLDKDVYFPRAALPKAYQGNKGSKTQDLVGVEVCIELRPASENRPRAEHVRLLLNWQAAGAEGEGRWVFKRR